MSPTVKKILLGVLALMVAISAFQTWWYAPDRSTQPQAAKATQRPERLTLNELIEQCQESTERNFHGRNMIEYDKEFKKLTIAVWIEDMDEAAVAAMVGTTGTRDAWDELVSDMVSACASWQNTFDRFGFSDVTVVMHLLNPSNLDNALISTARGRLTYDVVDGYVSSRGAVSQPTNQTFVINKKSKVFHLTTCGMIDQIKPENFDYYVGTREGAIANGYEPCNICDP